MHFTIMDENVSTTMNVFLIIANVINVVYNVPQVIKTYQTKSTRDFSGWFISLRIVGNVIWVAYAIEVDSMLMLINNVVTVVASIFIGYYKCIEIYKDNYSVMSKQNYKQFNMECEKCKSLPEGRKCGLCSSCYNEYELNAEHLGELIYK